MDLIFLVLFVKIGPLSGIFMDFDENYSFYLFQCFHFLAHLNNIIPFYVIHLQANVFRLPIWISPL